MDQRIFDLSWSKKLDEKGYPFKGVPGITDYAFPTLTEVQQWLRQEKKIDVLVYDFDIYEEVDKYIAVIRNRNYPYNNISEAQDPDRYPWEGTTVDSYEEALEEGLEKALELI